jgi:hypothetical protein
MGSRRAAESIGPSVRQSWNQCQASSSEPHAQIVAASTASQVLTILAIR